MLSNKSFVRKTRHGRVIKVCFSKTSFVMYFIVFFTLVSIFFLVSGFKGRALRTAGIIGPSTSGKECPGAP